MSRFDYITYDDIAQRDQLEAKKSAQALENTIEMILPVPGRAKSLALTALEECYMWIGKGIRDDQIKKGESVELNEARDSELISATTSSGKTIFPNYAASNIEACLGQLNKDRERISHAEQELK